MEYTISKGGEEAKCSPVSYTQQHPQMMEHHDALPQALSSAVLCTLLPGLLHCLPVPRAPDLCSATHLKKAV